MAQRVIQIKKTPKKAKPEPKPKKHILIKGKEIPSAQAKQKAVEAKKPQKKIIIKGKEAPPPAPQKKRRVIIKGSPSDITETMSNDAEEMNSLPQVDATQQSMQNAAEPSAPTAEESLPAENGDSWQEVSSEEAESETDSSENTEGQLPFTTDAESSLPTESTEQTPSTESDDSASLASASDTTMSEEAPLPTGNKPKVIVQNQGSKTTAPQKRSSATIKRRQASSLQAKQRVPRPSRPIHKRKPKKSNPFFKLIPIVGVLIAVGILAVIVSKFAIQPQTIQHPDDTYNTSNRLTIAEQAMGALSDARLFEEEHSNDVEKIMATYQAITNNYPDTPSAKTASRIIRRYQKILNKEIEACRNRLVRESQVLVLNNETDKAIKMLKNYDGAYKEQTAELRSNTVAKIKADIIKAAKEKNRSFTEKAIEKLLTTDIPSAYLYMKKTNISTTNSTAIAEYKQLSAALESAMQINDLIVKSFDAQKGKTVEVDFKKGKLKLNIIGVKNGKLQYLEKRGYARITKEIPLSELSNRERVKRAGSDIVGISLVMGMDALHQNRFNAAKQYMLALDSPLKDRMVKEIEKLRAQLATN